MYKHVLQRVIPIDESISALDVKPFYGSRYLSGDYLLLLFLLLLFSILLVLGIFCLIFCSHDVVR